MTNTSARMRVARANIDSYNASRECSLSDAYGRYSDAKLRAWAYCENLCDKFHGFDLRVISHNSFIFTAGFQYADPETGVLKFVFITPNYDTEVDY